jgi:outer membrane protein assembly factor BamB
MSFGKHMRPFFIGGLKERVVTETNGATMLNHGISIITATSAATPFTLAAPGAGGLGVHKRIVCLNATTTNTAWVTGASGVSLYATTNNSTDSRVMVFNADNEVIDLIAVSSGRYAILSNNNAVAIGATS